MSACVRNSLHYSMELVPDNLKHYASGAVKMSFHLGGIAVEGGVVVLRPDNHRSDMVIIPRMAWREVVKRVEEMFELVDKDVMP